MCESETESSSDTLAETRPVHYRWLRHCNNNKKNKTRKRKKQGEKVKLQHKTRMSQEKKYQES